MKSTSIVTCFLLLGCEAVEPFEQSSAPVENEERALTDDREEDEIGAGRTQGFATHARAAAEMSRRGRAQEWYELSHTLSATMPQNALSPETVDIHHLPTTAIGGPFQAANVESAGGPMNHAGTQFDALGHFAHLGVPGDPQSATYYNGFAQAEVKPQPESPLLKLGIDKAPPIVTTAVLLDAESYFERALEAGEIITAAHLRDMLRCQRVRRIKRGDVVLVRTGWERHWEDPDQSRVYYSGGPGLSEDAVRFLSSKQVVAIGIDAPFVDPFPPPPREDGITFIVHHVALVEEGIHLVENMRLSELARDRVWLSALFLLPARMQGGSGSTVRPVAMGVPHD
jgi:kynurenine formamidase